MNDPVSHPAHYGGDTEHETIKCLHAWGLEDNALLWNAGKSKGGQLHPTRHRPRDSETGNGERNESRAI